jgi:aminoglycoside 3-N-acetyltransferase
MCIRHAEEVRMSNRPVVTQSMLEAGLRTLGLVHGDAVEVHSSLRAFGWVDGGAAAIVDALMQIVGSEGTLVMSAYYVSDDIPLTADDKARGIHWKVKVLPEDSPEPIGLGAVVAEFLRRPGVVCGPGILRVCAWGQDADRHRQGYEYLLDIDGWILLLGVGIDACSSLHLAEDVRLPEQIRAYYQIPEDIHRDYDPQHWSIGYGGTGAPVWDKVYAEADRQGLIRQHQIGNATCQLFKARAMVTIYREWRRSDPFGLFEVPKDSA